MTLEEAIEEAKRRISRGYSQYDLHDFEETIVNAVASGQLVLKAEIERGLADPTAVHYSMLRGTIAKPSLSQIVHIYAEHQLIPKADADLAVAEALREAADACKYLHVIKTQDRHGPWNSAVLQCCELILALAPADALAEVQALRAERDQQKADANKWFDLALSNRHKLEAAKAEVARLREMLTEVYNKAKAIDVGQSVQPDHWTFRVNARVKAAQIIKLVDLALTPKGDTP